RRDAGEAFLEVLAVPLDRGAERPEVHAVGPDADGPAAAAGAERQDLIEAIEQAGPLLLANEPFELRPIGGEGRVGEPLLEILERLFLESGISVDCLKTGTGLGQQVHDGFSPEAGNGDERRCRLVLYGARRKGQPAHRIDWAKGQLADE